MIKVENVTKIYKTGTEDFSALKGVSFEIKDGEFVAIMGPSGSGKSTLMHILGALDTPSSGKYFLDGKDVSKLDDDQLAEIRNQKIGFVFQDHALFPSMNVIENVTFGLRMRGIKKQEREERASTWLTHAGLKGRERARVEILSGGERQRVALVRALICEPELLLLDEPFSALDASLKGALINHVLELLKLWPVPVLFVTHDEAELGAFATARYVFEESNSGQIRTLRKAP
jgi:putative ABC transport system ATP-binding protein